MTITHSTDVYYDPYHIDIVNDPYPVYARLREEAPIYYNERYDFWAISRYADVEKALSDWETFSNSRGDIPAGANRLDPSHCTSAARAPRRRGIGRRSTVVPVRAAIRVVGTAM